MMLKKWLDRQLFFVVVVWFIFLMLFFDVMMNVCFNNGNFSSIIILIGLDVPTIHSRYGISTKTRIATTVHSLFAFLFIDAVFDTESKR